jgi:nicotinate-nucleotide pyrophosphorylase (carboxylating)
MIEAEVQILEIPKAVLQEKLMDFLREDAGLGDITTDAVVPAETQVHAQIIVKEPAVVAGILEAKALFEMLGAEFAAAVEDGDEVISGKVIAEVEGCGRAILAAERTALNILMRMSGIATATEKLVKKVRDAGLDVRVAATRKTAPGLRYFDKKAVMLGGGDPHRFRLDDAFLVKDNHIEIAGGIKEAMEKVRSVASFSKKIEVEAKTKGQALEAAKRGADIVMLDNMTLGEVEETIKALGVLNLRDKVLIEISGSITEKNLLDYAKLEPDVISLGSLTHSVRAINMSLEVIAAKTEKQ